MNKYCRIAIALVLLITLTSCLKVGPNFKAPAVYVERRWIDHESAHLREEGEALCRWWEQFNDDKLNEIIRFGLNNNLSVKAACYRILEARALLGIAVGEFFPQQQNLIASATKFDLSKNAPNTQFADLRYSDFLFGLDASWELDFWGKFRRNIEGAKATLCASVDEYRDVLVLLYSDIARSYVLLRTLQERKEILEQNVKLQHRSLEIVDARYRAGVVTELDLQQVKTLLYDTRARIPEIDIDIRRASDALAVLLGTTPDRLLFLTQETKKIPESPESIAIGIPADLLCQRPDVRRALHQAEAQSARIGIAVADLLPAFSIRGFVGFESSADTVQTASGSGGRLFSADSFTYNMGSGFSWPILNYGRLTNRIYFERARFCELIAIYQNTVLNAQREVEDGLITFIKSHAQVKELIKSVHAAERASSLANTQYVEGEADFTRVLNSLQLQLEEQERLVGAKGEIAQGLIASYRALGGGW